MRMLIALTMLALAPPIAAAQDSAIAVGAGTQSAVRRLQANVAHAAIGRYNDPATLRFAGPTRVPAGRGVDGDMAVVGGPVTVAGRIRGSLLVINGDLAFDQGAVVDGDVMVVGGAVDGRERAAITGTVRVYRDPLYYRRDGDTLQYAPSRAASWRRPRFSTANGSDVDFIVALGGTYNRVEGVPITFGPRMDLRVSDAARLQGDARVILRTAEDFSLATGEFGYRVRGELVIGSRERNLGLGVRSFDQVTSIEPWPLKDFEAGWATFLLHNDYRDWFRRRGWGAFATLRPSRQLSVTLEGREERHHSAAENDPLSVFESSDSWRVNPAVTDGLYHTVGLGMRLDTRNDRSSPSSGVYLSAEVEATSGTDVTGTTDPLACAGLPCVPPAPPGNELSFQRAFVDARTFLRLSPTGRLNLRLAATGQLGGDAPPLQHRAALGFPDPLPGWDFRAFSCGGEALPGHPSLCDRAIVAQAEWRMHLGFDFGPDWVNDWGDDGGTGEHWKPFHVSGPDIVVFADAGRAWAVGTDAAAGEIPADRMPSLDSYKLDLGLGLDLGPVGFYLAKSVGAQQRPVTFHVRLGRRF